MFIHNEMMEMQNIMLGTTLPALVIIYSVVAICLYCITGWTPSPFVQQNIPNEEHTLRLVEIAMKASGEQSRTLIGLQYLMNNVLNRPPKHPQHQILSPAIIYQAVGAYTRIRKKAI